MHRLAAALLLTTSCTTAEIVAHDRDESAAIEIIAVLGESGIEASKSLREGRGEPRFDVAVAKDDGLRAYQTMKAHGLPRTTRAGTEEIIGDGSLVPKLGEEHDRRQVAAIGDIVNALERLPGVREAIVVGSIAEVQPLAPPDEPRPRSKASVVIVHAPSKTPPVAVETVRALVAARLPRVKPEEVHVAFEPMSAAPVVAGACSRTRNVAGITVCAGQEPKLIKLLLAAAILAGLVAGLAIIAVLRALRYRRELTAATTAAKRVPA